MEGIDQRIGWTLNPLVQGSSPCRPTKFKTKLPRCFGTPRKARKRGCKAPSKRRRSKLCQSRESISRLLHFPLPFPSRSPPEERRANGRRRPKRPQSGRKAAQTKEWFLAPKRAARGKALVHDRSGIPGAVWLSMLGSRVGAGDFAFRVMLLNIFSLSSQRSLKCMHSSSKGVKSAGPDVVGQAIAPSILHLFFVEAMFLARDPQAFGLGLVEKRQRLG